MTASDGRSAYLGSLILAFLLLAVAGPAAPPRAAQETASGWEVTALGAGGPILGNTYQGVELSRGGGLTVGYGWASGFTLGLGSRIWVAPEGGNPAQNVDGVEGFAQGMWRFATASAVTPVLGARAGYVRLERAGESVTGGMGALLGGADIWVTDQVAVRAVGVASPFAVGDAGGLDSGTTLGLELGVTISFGGRQPVGEDSDGDGIDDGRDLCDYTPTGVQVDSRGCPIDADRDGIADYQDDCPGTWAGARVGSDGCALDDDGDGIPNGLDRCPRTPEGAEVDDEGCAVEGQGGRLPDPRA